MAQKLAIRVLNLWRSAARNVIAELTEQCIKLQLQVGTRFVRAAVVRCWWGGADELLQKWVMLLKWPGF
jgi:hypothetical protein